MTFKEADKILRNNGWQVVRVKGSHYQYKKAGVDFLATLPYHTGKDLSIGVLKKLEKGTGLSFL